MAKYQEQVDAQAIDDAIRMLGWLVNPRFGLLNRQQKETIELGVAALRNLKVCRANSDKALEELLEKIDDIRSVAPFTSDAMDSVVRLLKEEPKKARQTGPSEGQRYWFVQNRMTDYFTCDSEQKVFGVFRHSDIYPEERFAEAESRAIKLISAVNKRRRELNEGKELGDHKCYIVFCRSSGVEAWEESNPLYARVNAYPFGLFKDYADCETCINEFEDELKWFYEEYLPLMEELDEYDWADAPGWGGEA